MRSIPPETAIGTRMLLVPPTGFEYVAQRGYFCGVTCVFAVLACWQCLRIKCP